MQCWGLQAVSDKWDVLRGQRVYVDLWISFASHMASVYQRLGGSSVYEVNLRQYTEGGDILSFRSHLPRLADMGVGILWFMPMTPISNVGRKGALGSYYACSDYEAVNPAFGTLDDFRQLVAAAQSLGMQVILDWVANHTGLDHRWTKEHPSFYKRNDGGEFYDSNGWDDVIDLDYSHPGLRQQMIQSMRFWIEATGIDGFRCDMAMLTPLDFWQEARRALDPERRLIWLAELDPLDHPSYMQVFDAAYTWRWMKAATECRHTGPVLTDRLYALLEHYRAHALWKYRPAWFTSNHDENSWNGTEYEKFGPMAEALAVLSCLWPGIPLLYSGQEIPNRQRLAFFDKDTLDWTASPALHTFYQRLLLLRRHHPAFDNEMVERVAAGAADLVFCFQRRQADSRILVILNFSAEDLPGLHLPDTRLHGSWKDLFSDRLEDPSAGICLPAWGYSVLVRP